MEEQQVEYRKGICGICPAGCWVKVGRQNGKIVSMQADESHPLGMICKKGEHAAEIVYSEHRLKYPLRRTGPKGTYNFERISWDEAYSHIVEQLQRIKEESGPEAVSIYTGRGAFELSLCDMYQPRDIAVSSASNILFPFGSPNTMGVGALCYVSFAMIAPHVTMGRMLINMFTDLEHAEMIVVWGANPATDSPPLDMFRLEAAAKRGADIVVIDPRRTETVLRTGARWIPIRPGTDGALALGIIEVLIEEELLNEDFVQHWCHGFDELRTYVQHFPPERVAEITGVPADTVRELARNIVQAAGCAPVMYTGLEYSNSGIQAIRAVLTAWALAGQLDVPGGIGLAMLNSHFPINRSCNQANPNLDRAVARDTFPLYSRYRGESHAIGLVDSVLKGDPYRIRGLLIDGGSILTSWPQTPLWRETLSKLDFLVCIDRQLTADAAYADIVLPATTMFEIDSYMVYGPIFRLREKLIEPVGEARNDYLIMAELAERLGYGELFPQSEEAMIRFALQGSGFTLEEIRAAGGIAQLPAPAMEYRKWEKGSLRSDGRPGFDTPTCKFEIHSSLLSEYGYEPLPKYTEPREGPLAAPDLARSFPLVFNSGARTHTDFRSQHHGIPGLLKDNPEPCVELNRADAEDREIRTGDLVEVSTLRGSVQFRAVVSEDIVQGAVEANMGGGTPVGPAAWQQANVNELTDLSNYDEISGFPVYKALLCEVVRIEQGTSASRKSAEKKLHTGSSAPQQERSESRRIYLDNNATTDLAPSVHEAMQPFLERSHGNPSSIYRAGRTARDAMEKARRQLAGLLHTKPKRIIFTGGGSEADNLALKGAAFACQDQGRHIITSAVEHPAVLETCRFLERCGFRVTFLPVDAFGMLDPEQLRRAITDETFLVSVMMANNEVGTILPIRELAVIAHQRNVLFHTDAVQAIGKIPVNAEELDVDLLSLSGHKFHGPKGVGALYVKKGVRLEPLIHGGKQESGLRAGTENVAALVGLGKAAELAAYGLQDSEKMCALRDRLEAGIKKIVPDAQLNGHPELRLPNTLNMTFPGIRGESLVIALDQHGISISSGSACKTGSPEPTHVLTAMGKSAEEAHCSLRFSLSQQTGEEEIDAVLEELSQVLEEMKNTIRFLSCK
ncbi:MAG: IscS subfamily cysteine desulfurase [Candidatus Electrothrix aestuarii]|uniref:cysteine desulfurase n=1 Tax=Candidatus Electrothrix aestuarii TaxID=3062594 RepID=A0AAU8LS66_9BACT|nr:IscS subfamily cysteine desulfurase [Candidatus Electrothrix aestuarii]